MQFNRIRLVGFKSFVDPSELYIEPGLTGIVGPNGCGKSNVVEALGWVMGENSPKRMRGGEMDDVIFAGTASRPPRNLAEVSVKLDNAERRAPAQFNDSDELEVTRRIERGGGSTYRVNGREVRARDVQLLFADAATGAHSTALVSQGRIDALIRAKPTDRRLLLEEAAGITGLHSRRHEAELRLRAAETNLERLDDVMSALEEQLQKLKRQVRQASRYRNISRDLRRAEALVLHLRWSAAREQSLAAAAALEEAEAAVGARTREAAVAATAEGAAAEALPPLREAEAATANRLHELAVARDGLDLEARRVAQDLERLEAHLRDIDGDAAREQSHLEEAEAALRALVQESEALEGEQRDEQAAHDRAQAEVASARRDLDASEAAFDETTRRLAALSARREGLQRQADGTVQRLGALQARLEAARQELAKLGPAAPEGEDAAALEGMKSARARASAARAAAEEAEAARLAAHAAEREAREALQEAETQATRLRTEVDTLARVLSLGEEQPWPPVIDALSVAPGFEDALGAALGDDLAIPSDEAAPVHWKTLPPLAPTPALPGGVTPLSEVVTAPPALARRLSQIGVVDDDERGPHLAGDLKQGQRLVSRSGGLWRWDGYTVAAGARNAAATRLAQRNRFEGLRRDLAQAAEAAEAGRARHARCRAELESASAGEADARGEARAAEQALEQAHDALAASQKENAERLARVAQLEQAIERLAADIGEAERELDGARGELADLAPREAEAQAEAAQRREALNGHRNALAERQAVFDRLEGEARTRTARLDRIAEEHGNWTRREASARAQIAHLATRRQETAAARDELATRPDELAARRSAILDEIGEAEGHRAQAADRLAVAEAELADRRRALKSAEESLAAAREERVRRDGMVQQTRERLDEVVARIRETLECAPEEALALAELKDHDSLPAVDWAESRIERLKRERDNLGLVNLRAEQEAEELKEQLDTMTTERVDLEAAIARLRQGIASLNREGRERLLAAFNEVDRHFRELYARLFGGGRAELALMGSDDPLEAGLEIMASPVGKRLQVITLLSGGEQALTAVALLFAVFLTNPAPICVLDEVDAPLDDTNVTRFCDLVDEIARMTGTRFMVVTHNPITMARMDRLYGVTMREFGISQLVSVDLASAEGLRAVG